MAAKMCSMKVWRKNLVWWNCRVWQGWEVALAVQLRTRQG